MIKAFQWIGIIVVFALIGFLTWNNIQLRKNQRSIISAHENQLNYLDDSLSNAYQYITKQGDTITQARQTIITLENAVQLGLLREENLRSQNLVKVETIARLEEEISIISMEGNYIIESGKDSVPVIPEPYKMEFQNQWFYQRISALPYNPRIDSLLLWNYPVLTAGWRKDPGIKNIFSRPIPVVNYENINPYACLSDIQYIYIEPEQQWYQTDAFKIGAGIVLGVSGVVLLNHFMR